MRFKKIVGFGDSWMWGDELIDPNLRNRPDIHAVDQENTQYRESKCFLGLLGQHYNLPTENFGIPGGSLQSTVWNYIWWAENETLPLDECIVLVGLSSPGRMSFYNAQFVGQPGNPQWNRYAHSSWVDSKCYSNELTTAIKTIMVMSQCDNFSTLNFNEKIMFFGGQSKIHNNNLIQFSTGLQYPENLVGPSNNNYQFINSGSSLLKLLKEQTNSNDLLAPKMHPNENGHKLIAQYLIPYVDSCIINGC